MHHASLEWEPSDAGERESPKILSPDLLSGRIPLGIIEASTVPESLAVEPLTPRLPCRIIARPLAENSGAFPFPQGFIVAPGHRAMGHAAVVPDGHGSWRPPPTDGQVVGGMHVFAQEGQHVDSFLLLQLLDVDHDRWVVEQSFEFGHGMGTDLSDCF